MIADYLAVKNRMKDRNLQESGELMNRRRDLEESFEPVVASNKKMVRDIVDELVPITRELRELNNKALRRYYNGVPMIGGKVIKIDGDNIVIDDDDDDEVCVGIPGLWSLIADKVPKNYDERDLERYKKLLHETSTLYQDYDPYN